MAAPLETDEELHARAAAEHIARQRQRDPGYRPTAAYLALASTDTPPQGNEDLL